MNTSPPIKMPATPLSRAFIEILKEMDARLGVVVNACLAGGVAVHIYTQSRVSQDIDMSFDRRVFFDGDLSTSYFEGEREYILFLDKNYMPAMALMHPDYLDDAIDLDIGLEHLKVKILTPTDLAVSKIGRLSDNDIKDIKSLVEAGLITADGVKKRADEAMEYFVGDLDFLKINIDVAVDDIRDFESKTELSSGFKP